MIFVTNELFFYYCKEKYCTLYIMLPLKFCIKKNNPVILLKKLCTLITYVTLLLPFFGEKCRNDALLCIINEKILCYFYKDIYFYSRPIISHHHFQHIFIT